MLSLIQLSLMGFKALSSIQLILIERAGQEILSVPFFFFGSVTGARRTRHRPSKQEHDTKNKRVHRAHQDKNRQWQEDTTMTL